MSAMSDDRAAFEAEMKAAGYAYSTDRRAMLYADGETYRSLAWQAGWEMWRAGMRAGIERAKPLIDRLVTVENDPTVPAYARQTAADAVRAMEGE